MADHDASISGEQEQVAVTATFSIEGPVDDDLIEAVRMALAGLGASDIDVREVPDA